MNNQCSPPKQAEEDLRAEELASLSEAERERLASYCKALGHPIRVQILDLLKSMDRCVCGELVDVLPLAQSTVSQHLKVLKEVGLVQGALEGPRTRYCLNKDGFQDFIVLSARL